MSELENQFHHSMIRIADFANSHNFGYRFRQMIGDHDAVEAAKRLLATQEVQTGLMRLWELDALDKSMEALVDIEHFHSLFTQEEIYEAHRRLYELGYFDEKP